MIQLAEKLRKRVDKRPVLFRSCLRPYLRRSFFAEYGCGRHRQDCRLTNIQGGHYGKNSDENPSR